MPDWKTIKCNNCKSFKKCKGQISKGSKICLQHLKLIPKEKQGVSKTATSHALIRGLLQKVEKK